MTFFLCRGEKQSVPATPPPPPPPLVELRLLASHRRISNSDLLWRDGWDRWRPVAEVPGVMTPELPAGSSPPGVDTKQPAAKRLDTTWETRIRERSQVPEAKMPSPAVGASDVVTNSQDLVNLIIGIPARSGTFNSSGILSTRNPLREDERRQRRNNILVWIPFDSFWCLAVGPTMWGTYLLRMV